MRALTTCSSVFAILLGSAMARAEPPALGPMDPTMAPPATNPTSKAQAVPSTGTSPSTGKATPTGTPVVQGVAPAAPPAPVPAARTDGPTKSASDYRVPNTPTPESAYEQSTYVPPKIVDYQGGRIPKDATIEERPRTAYVATGLSMAGGAYALSLFYAIGTCGAQMECRNGSAWLYAPLIGPFMTAGQAPTSGGRALAIFDGALQTVGVALFVAGFLAPKKVVVMYRDASWRVEPVQMGSGMGLGLTVKNL